MKHLFYVHSHITFLVSKQYVFDQGINPDDCLFLCTRNYQLPDQMAKVFHNIKAYPDEVLDKGNTRLLQNNNPFKGRKNVKKLESIIQEFFGESDFVYYLPNAFASDFSSAIVTMPHCKFFYIVEEGTASYVSHEKLPKLFWGWKRPIYYVLRLILNRYYCLRGDFYSTDHPKYRGTIATTSKAFFDVPGEKIVVSNPFFKEIFSEVPQAILSIDASLNIYFDIDVATKLYQMLAKIFDEKGYQKIAYKFHPDFCKKPELMQQYRDLLHQCFGDSIFELQNNSSIENILNAYPIDFYTDLSSVALYSFLWKGTCYSYVRFLSKYSDVYADNVKKMPQVLEHSFSFIDYD